MIYLTLIEPHSTFIQLIRLRTQSKLPLVESDKMSLTPQDNSRSTFSQGQPSRHVFQVQPNLPTPPPSQQQRAPFPRPTQGGIRPPGQHNSPYSTPYTPNNVQAQNLPPRQNGIQNGGVGVSAEQQIAQGVLSNASTGSGSNTPQRRPPPLGTTIHMPTHGTPQNQSMGIQNPPMSVNHAMNPASAISQGQRQSQNASPLLQNLAAQRPTMNSSPANSNMGSRPQDSSPNDSQDLSMIDPQLAIDQQLTDAANSSVMGGQSSPTGPPVAPEDMLSPPRGGSYPTFEALFAAAQAHALSHGYAFVIGRSKRDNRGLKKVFLICDRGGTNKEKVPGEQRQRKTKSRKCGCEFGVFGLETKTAWILRGRIDGEHLTHNHPPSESPTEHPGARVSVKETLEILHRDNPSVRYLPRDIYNARAAIKRDPSRVEATAMEELPTFYKKPPLTFEEKLRAELRTEVANAQAEVEKVKEDWHKEVEELKEQLRQKDKMIQKFEMFIDICNERVMVALGRAYPYLFQMGGLLGVDRGHAPTTTSQIFTPGPVMRVTPTMLLVSDAALLPSIYHRSAEKSRYYVSGGLGEVETLFNQRSNDIHAYHRRLIAAPYSFSKIIKTEPLVDVQIINWLKRMETLFVQTGKPLDFATWGTYLAFDIISVIGFGQPLGFIEEGKDIGGLIESIHASWMPLNVFSRLYPFTEWLKTTWFKSMLVATPKKKNGVGVLMRWRDKLLEQRLRDLEQGKKKERVDIMQSFLDARKPDGQPLDINYIKGEILIILLGGADTTATAFGAIITYLMSSPKDYARLLAEIDAADKAGKLSRPVAQFAEVIEHCPFYVACVKESMRLCPSSPNLSPRLVSSNEEPIIIGGRVVPVGTEMSCNPWHTGRDKKIYGEDAGEFRPQRWLEDEEKRALMERYSFVFGYGSRACLGKDIAWLELMKGPLAFFRDLKPVPTPGSQKTKTVIKAGVAYFENIWLTVEKQTQLPLPNTSNIGADPTNFLSLSLMRGASAQDSKTIQVHPSGPHKSLGNLSPSSHSRSPAPPFPT
ncbi:hypothetical protein G7Y89_g5919 [Cudoniella acicularis]|uniref:Cytochrome P450 n=1 Tax=Cudoniella acicularis TaxID=354080 RepID=A0A8H4RN73_9HELO|nr:hypothetical protein G7Y89_g5919 [Cudoniella acicularis]